MPEQRLPNPETEQELQRLAYCLHPDKEIGEAEPCPEGTKYEIKTKDKKRIDKVRIYIVQRIVQAVGVVIGIRVEDRGNNIFIPRKSSEKWSGGIGVLDELSQHIRMMGALGLSLDNGKAYVSNGRSRLEISSLGEGDDQADKKTVSREFDVPKKGKGARRIVTAVNRDDSFGKERWRRSTVQNMAQIFPGGIADIPLKDRKVLCFPGIGKEAMMWKEFGFEYGDMLFIERDEKIADELKKRFRGGHVFRGDFTAMRFFYNEKGPYEPIIVAPNELKRDMHPVRNNRFSVINLDPEGGLTPEFFAAIVNLFKHLPIADKCFFGVNFACKREGKAQIEFYRSLRRETQNWETPRDMKLDDLRFMAIQNLPRKAIEVAGKRNELWIRDLASGSYEGESSGTRMVGGMFCISRIQ